MTDPLDDLVASEREVAAPTSRRGAAIRFAVIAFLIVAAGAMTMLLGGMALKGAGDLLGVGLDARHCTLYSRAMSCSSVALSEINRVSRAGLPASSTVVESSWSSVFLHQQLAALVDVSDERWVPPGDDWEPCESSDGCTGAVPSTFEKRGITVCAEFAYIGPPSTVVRQLFISCDGSAGTWVAVTAED